MRAIWILILALFVIFANAAIRKDIVPRVPVIHIFIKGIF